MMYFLLLIVVMIFVGPIIIGNTHIVMMYVQTFIVGSFQPSSAALFAASQSCVGRLDRACPSKCLVLFLLRLFDAVVPDTIQQFKSLLTGGITIIINFVF